MKEFDTADDYEDDETEIEAGDKPIDPNFKPIPYYSLVSSFMIILGFRNVLLTFCNFFSSFGFQVSKTSVL